MRALSGWRRRVLREERGQILPLLAVVLIALIATGFALFVVARAADLRAQAQTAADAAALAGAEELAHQLELSARESPNEIDDAAIRREAEDYARRNDGVVTEYSREGNDVLVTVRTEEQLGEDGEPTGDESKSAEARARARVQPCYTLGAGVPTGDVRGEVEDAIRLAKSFGLVVTSYLRPGDTDSLHSQGLAVDVAGGPVGSKTGPMAQFYRAALARYSYIEELFYDPLGGIDKNRSIGPIGGHSDHVHIAFPPGGGQPGKDPEDVKIDPDELQEAAEDLDTGALTGGCGGLGSTGAGGIPLGELDAGGSVQIARTIFAVGKELNATSKQMLAAFETALVESNMQNVPAGAGDLDSVGVFQQRPSQGWGSVAELSNPTIAAAKFFKAAQVSSQGGTAGQLAQRVQRSAFGYKYDQREAEALRWIERVRDDPLPKVGDLSGISIPAGAGGGPTGPAGVPGGGPVPSQIRLVPYED